MTAWQDHVDVAALGRWMDGQGLPGGPVEHAVLLGGGTQNILLRFQRGGRDYVLRRPPPHVRAESNETMRREARLLGALADTAIPHPRLIAACGEEGVLGTAFYLMEPVEGFNAAVALPPSHRSLTRQMGLALAEAAAALGEIDPVAVGLGDFGRTENYLGRQAARWRRQLEGYGAYPDWPGLAALPDVAAIGDWLERHCPTDFRAGILHGDYHIGNVMFAPDSARIAAIVDWELSTVGDPLVDLGWLIATWGWGDADPPIVPVEPWEGFPTTGELADAYAAQSTRSLAALDWYVVLACYKLGIILEGTYARASSGLDDGATGASLHASAVRLFERALRLTA
ncbi:MAG TPA: phosphotransferase family protein [Sphingobium sp.]